MRGTGKIFICGVLFGAMIAAGGSYLIFRQLSRDAQTSSGSDSTFALDDPFADGAGLDTNGSISDPFRAEGWMDSLEKLSGEWTSADGQQNAKLDFRTLHFHRTGAWADLENHTYLLGQEMQFLSEAGFYSVCQMESPDALRIIKKDLDTEDVYGFTIYRVDSQRARAREPLGDVTPPPSVQKLLDEIPSIRQTDRKVTVLQRMGIEEDRLEILDGSSSLGETDLLLNLGVDDHWMLKLGYKSPGPEAEPSEATLKRFQIVRGYVADARDSHFDVEQFIYPYFVHDKVVKGPSSAEQVVPPNGP